MADSGRFEFDADVLVIGSGFGGSVAALRFSEIGERVLVLERGDWVRRDNFEADPDAFWAPRRHRFGINELRPRGRNIIPWLGAGVGGGSHVYAATLKRRETFAGFPSAISTAGMAPYYDRAEDIMGATRYPDYPPYSRVRSTQLFYEVGKKLLEERPDITQEYGPINLGISFAPPEGGAGEKFTNKHGAPQRYSDPREHSLLGGDIDSKNSLDRNYLFLAQQHGTKIRPLCQADRIECLPGGGWRVHYTRYVKETSASRRLIRNWIPFFAKDKNTAHSVTAVRLVVSAGAIGSTELLLRNRDVHKTLPGLSDTLGERYTSNGDFISLMLPFRGFFVSWAGVAAFSAGAFLGSWRWMGAGVLAYSLGLLFSRPAFDPDIGAVNSDYIKFRHRDGSSQGAYVESGRYPTPIRGGIVLLLSSLGLWRPHRYGSVVRFTNFFRKWVPPFELIARSWPIPLLKMGRDDAVGTFRLDAEGQAYIDYPFAKNLEFYRYLNQIGRAVAKAGRAWWLPNFPAFLFKRVEIPHNQGGCTMGDNPKTGVVDHAGRVYGHDNLMVLDGSLIPLSPGPNPALTILALSERAMEVVVRQVNETGMISPDTKVEGMDEAQPREDHGHVQNHD